MAIDDCEYCISKKGDTLREMKPTHSVVVRFGAFVDLVFVEGYVFFDDIGRPVDVPRKVYSQFVNVNDKALIGKVLKWKLEALEQCKKEIERLKMRGKDISLLIGTTEYFDE